MCGEKGKALKEEKEEMDDIIDSRLEKLMICNINFDFAQAIG